MVSDEALGGRACGLVTARINKLTCIFIFLSKHVLYKEQYMIISRFEINCEIK